MVSYRLHDALRNGLNNARKHHHPTIAVWLAKKF